MTATANPPRILTPAKLRRTLRLIPGYDPFATAGDCRLDVNAANEALYFFEHYLTHVEGALAGTPLHLEPWQQAFIGNLWGWKRPDGTRRYRESFCIIPRKNSKSTMAAGILDLVLFTDGEPGAQCFCAAANEDQAGVVFRIAKGMVEQNPELSGAAKLFSKAVTIERLGSFIRPISSKPRSKHGLNVHCAVIDELHAHQSRELLDVLMTGTGARRQPLIVEITTADYQRPESVCNKKYDYACKVRDGVIDDPSFLPVIYEAKREDDWTDPKVWAKANPNLGISVDLEYIRHECMRAKEEPAYENEFKRLHLNIQTEQAERWIQMHRWEKNTGGELDVEALKGQRCWGGLDLSSTEDITALVLIFPDQGNAILPFFWIPEEGAGVRQRKDRVPYLTWAQQGYIETTPGDQVDYAYIRQRVNEVAEQYKLQEIAYDPWNATDISQKLREVDGINMCEFRQGILTMNEPCKKFYAALMRGEFKHFGNPVLRWMASNVALKRDPADNWKTSKSDSADKIDGIVALIMAHAIASRTIEDEGVMEFRFL